ncbi:MAG: SURF1 family protein [Pseudomonadota bacterium]
MFDLGPVRFSAPLVPILSALLVFPLLLSLGFWQVGRAAERQALLDASAAAVQQAPVSLDDVSLQAATPRYVPVAVRGRVDASRQFLLDNRVNGKVAGYEVLTPVIYKPGKAILINRGWIPLGASRVAKPDVALPDGTALSVEFTGLAVVPPERFSLGDAAGGDTGWPRVLQVEDFAAISALLGLEVLPRVVQSADIAWGFESIWKPVQKGPEQNYAYALQWFALAATLVLIVVVLCVRKRQENT